jgi:arabinan endo-1,5-alpha-L-arabinosidase
LLIALGIFLAVNHHTQQTILQGHTAGLQGSSLQTEHINTLATSRYYKNPLVEVNLPDPTVIKAQGKYFAYTTQTYGKSKHLPMLVSNNLIAWRFLGDALPHKPVWALDSDKGNTWAPDATRINDLYYLYFSETLKTKGMGIAVETSKSPEGPFHVVGPPLLRAHGYRDIDPFVFQEKSGELLLYWGSAKRPIKVQRLSSDGTSLLGKPQKVLYPSNDTTYDHLIEGADVIRHGAFYYLFYSGNRCCRERAHYAELVARSLSPVGPFKRDPKNPVIEKNQVFKAPGHGTVFKDAMGDSFILYHAMQLSDPTFQRYLMLDRIQWQGGWPVVNGGNGPSSTRQPRPSPT